MKGVYVLAILASVAMGPVYAQDDVVIADTLSVQEGKLIENQEIEPYRRSSLYSVLIRHSKAEYGATIDSVFMEMQLPDKFNNHDVEPKSFESSQSKAVKFSSKKIGDVKKDANLKDIDAFMKENGTPNALVAKWFNMNRATGECNMDLIFERGYYDASAVSIEEADASVRGRASLADGGMDLIDNTFMIVNDITFIDHGKNSEEANKWITGIGSLVGGAYSAVTGDDDMGKTISSASALTGELVSEIAGFKVNIITYLYRLDWDKEKLDRFFNDYWSPEGCPDPARLEAFNASDFYTMSYVGYTKTSAENLSSKTFSKRPLQEQFMRVCSRAVDKAVVELQREYDEFKVKVPIYSVNEDGTVDIKIGLKEGVNGKSRYEVLIADYSNGPVEYKRVGMLKPVENMIWDNRFGALEEAEMLEADRILAEQEKADAESSEASVTSSEQNEASESEVKETEEKGNPYLGATRFEIISGKNSINPGMLVREVRVASEKNK